MFKTRFSLSALFALLLIGLAPTSSFALMIKFSVAAIQGPGVGTYQYPGMTALPINSLLRVGKLDIGGYYGLSSSEQNDFAKVDSLFTEMKTLNANFLGQFVFVDSMFDVPTGFLYGDQLYIWVFNASSGAVASAWGIFSSSLWFVPQNDGDSATLSTGTVDQVIRGSSLATKGNFALAATPEPGSGMLAAAGVAMLALRRRRPCA